MKNKPYHKILVALSVLLAFFIFVFACGLTVLIASATVDGGVRTLPTYEKVDISAVLSRDSSTWNEDDFDLLEKQTGILSKAALEKQVLSAGENSLLYFQDALFYEGALLHTEVVPGLTYHDVLQGKDGEEFFEAPIVTPEAGDVIVTSSTHTVGYRHGHAALILSGGRMLQSVALGIKSRKQRQANRGSGLPWFSRSSNFILLRLKRLDGESDEEYATRRRAVADEGEAHLVDIPYSLTVGIFSKKDQGTSPTETQCAHLVWQAYKNCGFEIDSNGGALVTPRDIARSPLFEIVQVYGFDPSVGW